MLIEYELSLKDKFSNELRQAKAEAEEFEKTIQKALVEKVEEAKKKWKDYTDTISGVKAVMGDLGIDASFLDPGEFLKAGIEKFHGLEQSVGQLKVTLANTKSTAGLTFTDLEKSADSLSGKLPYSKQQIVDMQSALIVVPGLTKSAFGSAQQAIADMATHSKEDLTTTTKKVAEALQEPVSGITKLGLHFSDAQKKMVADLVKTGDTAQAQSIILQQMNKEFGGSAKAAADLDPLFRYNKLIQSTQITVGQVGMALVQFLAPALEVVAGVFQQAATFVSGFVDWIKRNRDMLIFLGEAVGTVVLAYAAFQAWSMAVYLWTMRDAVAQALLADALEVGAIATDLYTTATEYATGAMEAMNIAFAANPVGFVVVGITALIAVLYEAYQHFEKVHGVVWALWGIIKEVGSLMKDFFMGYYHFLHGIFTLNISEIKDGASSMISTFKDAPSRISNAASKSYDEGIADFKEKKEKENEGKGEKSGTADATTPPLPGTTDLAGAGKIPVIPGAPGTATGGQPGAGTPVQFPASSSAGGTKSLTINISINKQIETLNIKTTNLVETALKVQEQVAMALTNAVNQSQITAGGR